MKKFQISNFKFQISNGFTLIELLVVIGIFIILAAIVLSILITVLRGAKKSDSIIVTKQNGEQAMTQMVKALRFAQSLDYPNPAGGAAPACDTTGSFSLTEVRVTGVNTLQTIIKCPGSFTDGNYIEMNLNPLTSKDMVVVKSCNFACVQQPGSPPVINISFDLIKKNPGQIIEEKTSIPFKSSVELRNLAN